MAKNNYAKMRPTAKPYEIWASPLMPGWEWHILKKWQIDDNKPNARWFCLVKSPIVPEGEIGDVYVDEIKNQAKAIIIKTNI